MFWPCEDVADESASGRIIDQILLLLLGSTATILVHVASAGCRPSRCWYHVVAFATTTCGAQLVQRCSTMHARVASVQYLLDGTHSYKLGTRSLQASPQARVRSLGSMRCDAMRCDAMHARQGNAGTVRRINRRSCCAQGTSQDLHGAALHCARLWGTGPFERARHLVQTRTTELASLHCAAAVRGH